MNKALHAQTPLVTRTGMRLGIAVAIIISVVAVGRFVWLSLYGADLPFWDQWAQVTTQLVPLKQGTWQYSEYWSPHNEHRVLFTRLISLALFEINGGIWSNLVEAYVNTVIYSATLGLFYALACKRAGRTFCIIMALAVITFGVIPYDWENNLVGFQNQFYVMEAFAITLAGISAYRSPTWSTVALLTALAVASLFTMASGLFGAAAVCAVVILRAWREPLPRTYVAPAILAMVLVVICGFLLLPNAPGNDGYKANGIADHIRAIAIAFMWPLNPGQPKYFLLALLIWAPSALWCVKFIKTRSASDREIFLIGLVVWVALQTVAIAHARGHDIASIPSRYTNILTIGLLANLALALNWTLDARAGRFNRYVGGAAIALGVGVISFVFIKRLPEDMDGMRQRYDFSRMETFYTHSYLVSKNPAFLQHSSLTIPFPDAAMLKGFLDSPVVYSLLPPTLTHASDDSELNSSGRRSLARIAHDTQASVQQVMAKVGVNAPSIFFKAAESAATMAEHTSPVGTCSVTNVNETTVTSEAIFAKSGDPIRFYGWVINPQSQSTSHFALVLDGEKSYQLDVDPYMKRKDVANVMHSKLRNTKGFRAYGILQDVAPGRYSIRLMTPADPSQVICNLPYQLVITS